MIPNKALGLDGMTTYFYQRYWEVLGGDITKASLQVLNGNADLSSINKTNIVLIPKVRSPSSPKQYRPISLCNIIYKIIAKVLANRLKLMLNEIIGQNQCAFVPGRLIFDNAMVTFETVHSMKERQMGNVGEMALKLDMSKAYNRVEWKYLEGVMRIMGFFEKWISLMMKCVESITYSVFDQWKTMEISNEQGDHLFPYLFLLYAKGFSSLLHKAQKKMKIQ